MLEWNTKHFPLNLQSGLTLSNFRDVGGGFELRNQIRHCKTVCIKRNLCLINYNRMRTQWIAKGNRDAGSSCLCDRGLHQYLRNFRGGVWTPQTPLSVRHWFYLRMVCRSHSTCVRSHSRALTEVCGELGGGELSIGKLPTGFFSNYLIKYNVCFGRVLTIYLDILACYFVYMKPL